MLPRNLSRPQNQMITTSTSPIRRRELAHRLSIRLNMQKPELKQQEIPAENPMTHEHTQNQKVPSYTTMPPRIQRLILHFLTTSTQPTLCVKIKKPEYMARFCQRAENAIMLIPLIIEQILSEQLVTNSKIVHQNIKRQWIFQSYLAKKHITTLLEQRKQLPLCS